MRTAPQPPIEYLASASHTSLEAFELARLNQIARLRTEILQILEELVSAEVEARLAHRLSAHPSLNNVLLLAPPGPTRPRLKILPVSIPILRSMLLPSFVSIFHARPLPICRSSLFPLARYIPRPRSSIPELSPPRSPPPHSHHLRRAPKEFVAEPTLPY
jgi:hypothetical protein